MSDSNNKCSQLKIIKKPFQNLEQIHDNEALDNYYPIFNSNEIYHKINNILNKQNK